MEDFKIYIVAIWKISEYTYSLYKNHFCAVYNLHIEMKVWYLFDFFQIQCGSVLSMFCRQC